MPGSWPRAARVQQYGLNDMATGRPSLVAMAAALLVYPVYVIQVQQRRHAPATISTIEKTHVSFLLTKSCIVLWNLLGRRCTIDKTGCQHPIHVHNWAYIHKDLISFHNANGSV